MPLSQAANDKNSARESSSQGNHLREHGDQELDRQSFMQKRYWLKATAVSSAAVSMVSSIASESVAIPQANGESVLPIASQPDGYKIARTTQSIDQSEPVLPSLAQTDTAAFSPSQPSLFQPSSSQAKSKSATAQPSVPTAQTSLIRQAQDGSWTLSTQVSASSATQRSNAAASQDVLSKLAKQARQTRQACRGRRCRGLAYVESKLPEARQAVEDLQAQLNDFEAHHAQQDMESYQELLTDRIFEITQQKQDLRLATEQTQQLITQFKTMLVQMDADLELAERALAADMSYQAAWNRLIQAEQNLMNEFSQVKLDATELNEIYGDYQYHQQQAQTLAGETLGNYLMQAPTVPGFIERSPEALNFLQDLTIATHEYRTQKLRQATIGKIEKRLGDRKSQLVGDISGYESLQRELKAAKTILEEYEKERAYLFSQQSGQGADQTSGQLSDPSNIPSEAQQTLDRSSTALGRVRRLVPLLPEGSAAQGVLYTVLAAGAIAAIAVRRRDRKPTIPQLALQDTPARDYSFQPTALQQANLMAAIKLPSLRFSAAQLQTEGASLQPTLAPFNSQIPHFKDSQRQQNLQRQQNSTYQQDSAASQAVIPTNAFLANSPASANSSASANSANANSANNTANSPIEAALLSAAPAARLHGEDLPSLEEILAEAAPAQPAPDNFEQRILEELLEITGQSTHMLAAAEKSTNSEAENNLTIEMMVRDLNEVLDKTTPEGSLAQEIQSRELAPVQISLDDVNLLAEHAVQWILKDLGFSPMAAALDQAEAEARSWNEEATADIEAISIESLEIMQPTSALTYQASNPETDRERADSTQIGSEKATRAEVSKEFATVAA